MNSPKSKNLAEKSSIITGGSVHRGVTTLFTKPPSELFMALNSTIPENAVKSSMGNCLWGSFNSAIHKAASLTVPSRSMITTGTIPVKHKVSTGCQWERLAGTTSGGCSSQWFFGNGL